MSFAEGVSERRCDGSNRSHHGVAGYSILQSQRPGTPNSRSKVGLTNTLGAMGDGVQSIAPKATTFPDIRIPWAEAQSQRMAGRRPQQSLCLAGASPCCIAASLASEVAQSKRPWDRGWAVGIGLLLRSVEAKSMGS